MIWLTWRQFRAQGAVVYGAMAAVAFLLLITASRLTDLWHPGQQSFFDVLQAQRLTIVVFNVAFAAVMTAPAIIGAFWGAPLIARELETGTHRLAWNQSVTRTRWLATKLAVTGAASAVTAGLFSWGVSAWAHHIDHAKYYRITPMVFGARGVVPIGYALFAFALGVPAGMLIRRTVPAMAATLGLYVAAVGSMPLWIRGHLVPATRVTSALDTEHLGGLSINRGGGAMRVFG